MKSLESKHFVYKGYSPLPKAPWTGGQRPRWNYGGYALAYDPVSDSLFGSGHIYFPGLVSQISIPATDGIVELQPWGSVLRTEEEELHRLAYVLDRQGGLAFLDGRLHWAFYRYYAVQPSATIDDATHGNSSADLSADSSSGFYRVGPKATRPFHQDNYGTYLFAFPKAFADEHLGGRRIGTGRLGGAGPEDSPPVPSFFAYDPADSESAMVLYHRSAQDKPDNFHPTDRSFGADFVEWKGRQAIVAVVWKGLGEFWYGKQTKGDLFDPCRTAKGYHSQDYTVQLQIFDPLALQELEPEIMTISELGACKQPGGCAFNSKRGEFYIFEASANPKIHVWSLEVPDEPTEPPVEEPKEVDVTLDVEGTTYSGKLQEE